MATNRLRDRSIHRRCTFPSVTQTFLLVSASLFLYSESTSVSAFHLDCSSNHNGGTGAGGSVVDDWESSGPTPAPSTAQPCDTQTSNARGFYTSKAAPCIMRFHSVDAASRDWSPTTTPPAEMDLIDYHTSDLCTDQNSVDSNSSSSAFVMKEYITNWPDECVGDFQRCYSLEHHYKVLEDFLCAKEWYQLPMGTTHISVDCSNDKNQYFLNQRKSQQQAIWNTYMTKFVNLAIVFISCVAGIYIISLWIIRPLSGKYPHTFQHSSNESSSIMMTSVSSLPQSDSSINPALPTSLLRNSGRHHRRLGSDGSYGSTDQTPSTLSSHHRQGNDAPYSVSSSLTTTPLSERLHGGRRHRRFGSDGSYGSVDQTATTFPNTYQNNAHSSTTNEETTIQEGSHLIVVVDEDPRETPPTDHQLVEEFNRQIPVDFDAIPIPYYGRLHNNDTAIPATEIHQQLQVATTRARTIERETQLDEATTRQLSFHGRHHPEMNTTIPHGTASYIVPPGTISQQSTAAAGEASLASIIAASEQGLVHQQQQNDGQLCGDTNQIHNITTDDNDNLEYTAIPLVPATPLTSPDHIVVYAEATN